MKSTAKFEPHLRQKERERERERQKQKLTSALDTSGWVWTDGETPDYKNPCQVNRQQVFHSGPQTTLR